MFSSKRREYLALALILTGLLVISFYDVVFWGKTFKVSTATTQAMHYGVYGQEFNRPKFIPMNGTDNPVQEEPTYAFIKENLKKGILPLWNPHQACGFPLIAVIEAGIFFPLTLIMYLLPNLYAWDFLIFSRFLTAGILTYWFMRTLRFRKPIALACAIMFMLSGPMVLLQYWTANVDILLPLLLLFLERLIRRPSPRIVGLTALAVGLTFLAGHPEHIFFVNVYGFIYFVFRAISLRQLKNIRPLAVSYTAANLLGIGLAALVFWPFISNFHSEFWNGHPPGVGLHNEEIVGRIITLMTPFFYQKETLTYDFTFSGWWGGYLGTYPVWLACLGLLRKQRRGLNYFFFVMGFLIISKAYSFPFINWIGYLPIFNMCRYAIHTPHLAAFSVAIAAGMGLRALLAQRKTTLFPFLVSLTATAIVGYNLWGLRLAENFPIAREASYFFIFLLVLVHILLFLRIQKYIRGRAFALLMVIIIFFELFSYVHREHPVRFASFPKVPYIEFLKAGQQPERAYGFFWAFYPNTASAYGADDLGMFFGMLPQRFVHFVNTLIQPGNFKNDLRPPALRAMPIGQNATSFLDMLNVRYIVIPPAKFLKSIMHNYEQVIPNEKAFIYAHEVNILPRPSAFERVYIVHKAIVNPNVDYGLAILKRTQANLREFIMITDKITPEFLKLNNTPVQDNSHAHITRYSPNEVVVQAEMGSPGFLVLSDAYHPDWKAYVNGKETKVYLTNGLIRSVFLETGHSTVKFVFWPVSFYGGLIISALSLSTILLLTLKNKKG